jgi:hypothetical protein
MDLREIELKDVKWIHGSEPSGSIKGGEFLD